LHVDSVCCFGLRHVGVRKTRHPSEVPAGVRPCYHWAARSPSEPVGNSNATGMPAFQKILFYQLVKNFQQPVVRLRCIEFDTDAFGSLGLLPWSVRIHFDTPYLNRYIAATDWRSGGSIADRCPGATVSDGDVYGSRGVWRFSPQPCPPIPYLRRRMA